MNPAGFRPSNAVRLDRRTLTCSSTLDTRCLSTTCAFKFSSTLDTFGDASTPPIASSFQLLRTASHATSASDQTSIAKAPESRYASAGITRVHLTCDDTAQPSRSSAAEPTGHNGPTTSLPPIPMIPHSLPSQSQPRLFFPHHAPSCLAPEHHHLRLYHMASSHTTMTQANINPQPNPTSYFETQVMKTGFCCLPMSVSPVPPTQSDLTWSTRPA
jgi:hypothetical protein